MYEPVNQYISVITKNYIPIHIKNENIFLTDINICGSIK